MLIQNPTLTLPERGANKLPSAFEEGLGVRSNPHTLATSALFAIHHCRVEIILMGPNRDCIFFEKAYNDIPYLIS